MTLFLNNFTFLYSYVLKFLNLTFLNQQQTVRNNKTERWPIFKNAPGFLIIFCTLETKQTSKCNEKQDGALANFQKRFDIFLLILYVFYIFL